MFVPYCIAHLVRTLVLVQQCMDLTPPYIKNKSINNALLAL